MGTTVKDVLVAARALVAATAVSRKLPVAAVPSILNIPYTFALGAGSAGIGSTADYVVALNGVNKNVHVAAGAYDNAALKTLFDAAFGDTTHTQISGSGGSAQFQVIDPVSVLWKNNSPFNLNYQLGIPDGSDTVGSAAVAAIAAEYFLEHKTSEPFEKSPISKRDGFEVVAREIVLTGGFGVHGDKEGQFMMVLRLGHSPFGIDKDREGTRVDDITRLADILEQAAWPSGVFTVLFEKEESDKRAANWWITEMFFKVVYAGTLQLT